jgi:aryl-alcohol dehydrogenase-like predicted oxidoreductase
MHDMTPSPLGTRILGSSGLRVSELCLGTMTFGTDWGSDLRNRLLDHC